MGGGRSSNHYHVIITSLLRHHYKWRNCTITSSLLLVITLDVSIIILISPIITVITYYYVFELGQHADDAQKRMGIPRKPPENFPPLLTAKSFQVLSPYCLSTLLYLRIRPRALCLTVSWPLHSTPRISSLSISLN